MCLFLVAKDGFYLIQLVPNFRKIVKMFVFFKLMRCTIYFIMFVLHKSILQMKIKDVDKPLSIRPCLLFIAQNQTITLKIVHEIVRGVIKTKPLLVKTNTVVTHLKNRCSKNSKDLQRSDQINLYLHVIDKEATKG